MIARLVRRLSLAMTSLTVIPSPVRLDTVDEADLAASRWGFPIVGVGLGLLLAMLSWGLGRSGCPGSIAATLLLAAWATITGGLHLDGLADSADGLFLGGGSERRLAVMKDPHAGSFGVAALILLFLGKYAALTTLSGGRRERALVLAAAVGRTLILVAAGMSRYARPEGTGRVVIESSKPVDNLVLVPIILLFGLALAGWLGVVAASLAILATVAVSRVASQRLGGVTGDILGAVVEMGEWVILVILGWHSGG